MSRVPRIASLFVSFLLLPWILQVIPTYSVSRAPDSILLPSPPSARSARGNHGAELPAFVTIPSASALTAAERGDPKAKITVRVYNMAKVPATVLAEAENEATQIFGEAGIAVSWRECPCQDVLGPSELMMRVIPRLFGSAKADFREKHLGFAPSGENGGVMATIFYHRVEDIAKGGDISPLLGHAMAHEIGHLLIGRNAHAPEGLMRAYWGRDVLKLVKEGLLRFTADQAETMRANLMARTGQKESLQGSLTAFLKEQKSTPSEEVRYNSLKSANGTAKNAKTAKEVSPVVRR